MKYLLKRIIILSLITGLFTGCQKEAAELIHEYLKPPLAEAGNPRSITLPVSFDTLHGSGISYNGSIRGYLWSLI
jgi:hypothetical protein